MTHNAKSGVAHFAAEDDRDTLRLIRELVITSYSIHYTKLYDEVRGYPGGRAPA